MFKVGDRVVYPNHGVGEIEDESRVNLGGQDVRFFTVRIVASKSTVKVPANNASTVGLRHLIGRDEIETVFAYLRGPELAAYDDWKDRFKQNSDLMRTGRIGDMAMVLKNLHVVALDKPLSFREKRMFERSLYLVVSEIAEVRKTPQFEIQDSVSKALGHFEKTHMGK